MREGERECVRERQREKEKSGEEGLIRVWLESKAAAEAVLGTWVLIRYKVRVGNYGNMYGRWDW